VKAFGAQPLDACRALPSDTDEIVTSITFNQRVLGSSPRRLTNKIKRFGHQQAGSNSHCRRNVGVCCPASNTAKFGGSLAIAPLHNPASARNA